MNSRSKPENDVILLFGPTASGKTDLLFFLKQLVNDRTGRDIEVISADSMQVYRGLDIGTAKPTISQRSILKHWLIDIINPDIQFDLGDFIRLAENCIKDMHNRNIIPVISGGTGFYFKHLLTGLPSTPDVDSDIREKVEEIKNSKGNQGLLDLLSGVDPVSANRIHPNDVYRLSRALEIYYASGKPLSSFAVPNRYRNDINPVLIGIHRDREELYTRIDNRVDQMIREGLVDEVCHLHRSGYGADTPAMRGIGYREFFTDGQLDTSHLDITVDKIKTNTRRYAKRQITFFKPLQDVYWCNPREKKHISDIVLSSIS